MIEIEAGGTRSGVSRSPTQLHPAEAEPRLGRPGGRRTRPKHERRRRGRSITLRMKAASDSRVVSHFALVACCAFRDDVAKHLPVVHDCPRPDRCGVLDAAGGGAVTLQRPICSVRSMT